MTYNRPQLPLTGNIARADLQRLSDDFTVALDGDDIAGISNQLGASAAGLNYLKNNDWRTWAQTTIAVPSTWTTTATDWTARGTFSPSQTTGMALARSEDAVHPHVIYCASITGEPNGVNCELGQRLSSSVVAALLESGGVLTIELENKTGASHAPELVFESCNVRDDFSATTVQMTWPLTAIGANVRVTQTKALVLTSVQTAARRGGIFYVRLPGMASASNEWRVYYARLEPGTVATPRRIDRDNTPSAASVAPTDVANYFANAAFVQWMTPAAATLAVEDVDNYTARQWGVTPSDGSTATIAGSASAPDARSAYALQITGDAAVTGTVDVHQNIHHHVAAHLAADVLNVSWWVFNNTGAIITPSLLVDTCSSANSTTRTNRLTQAMQACSSGVWTRVTLSITPGALTNWANGARLSLRFPTGCLNTNGKSVRVAQAQLIRGTAPLTFSAPLEIVPPPVSSAGSAVGITATRPTSTSIAFACAEATCAHPDGSIVTAHNVNTTMNLTGCSNSQWYLIRLAADETGRAVAVAFRENAPTTPAPAAAPPTGFNWLSDVVGSFYFIGGAVAEFAQKGAFVSQLAVNADTTTTVINTYTQVPVFAALEAACPEAAVAVSGTIGTVSGVALKAAIAATSSGLGAMSANAPATAPTAGTDGFFGACPFRIAFTPTASPQRQLWVKNTVVGVVRVAVSGYELP